ncbi:MAG: MlaD family protein [Bacteriovoracaceae bacterium]
MREKEKRNLIKTGVFISLMAGVFMVFAVTIGTENQFFSKRISLEAVVPSANNLREGAMVQLKGIKAGKAREIDIVGENKVRLRLEINAKFLKWIKKDSLVDISSQGLVGDKIVEIKGGSSSSKPFNPDSDVLKPHPSLTLPDIAEQGGAIAQRTERALIKFEVFLDQMNKDANIYSTLKNVNKASERLDLFLRDLDKNGLARKMASTFAKMDKAMGRVHSGPGTVHSLIYEEELYNRLNEIVGGAGRSKVLKYFIRKSLEENQKKENQKKEKSKSP